MRTSTFMHPRPLLAVVLLALCVVACRQAGRAVGPGGKPIASEMALRAQLNPALQTLRLPPASLAAPPPPNPLTIFPVQVRPWLPPAETAGQPRVLPGDIRIATSAPLPLGESPLLAPFFPQPGRIVLPAGLLARTGSRDPGRISTWVAINPVTDPGGQPPRWDRSLITTDPTAGIADTTVAAPMAGLRETPPPFLRVNIPDPFEQISIAELRDPPQENDAPVSPFTRPAIRLVEAPTAAPNAK